MVDLRARHASAAEAVEEGVLAVLRSGRYVGGPVVREAEAVAARWLGRRWAVGVNSGTDALILAMQAVGVGHGAEVIVPALTFFATAGAVCAVGARPVVADVGEDGLLDPDAAAAVQTGRTAAVIPVHLFGSSAGLPDLGVPVIDDAAQAVGAAPPCTPGVLTAVSAYATKVWAAAGDAGFVAGDDPALCEQVRMLANHGTVGPHHHERVQGAAGRNSRLDAIQAAVLLAQAPGLQQRVDRRRRLAERYDVRLPTWVERMPRPASSPVHVYAVRLSRRAAVRRALAEQEVETAVYYPRSLAAQPALSGPHAPTPVADRLATELLALPVHADLRDEDVDRVCDALGRLS